MKPKQQSKTRSYVAISAHFQTGAGTHGGGKKQRARKSRKNTKLALRRGDWNS